MTPRVRITVEDVHVDNSRRIERSDRSGLSLISFTAEKRDAAESLQGVVESCVEELLPSIEMLLREFPSLGLSIFLAHSVWSPDSRVHRYKKLWKSHAVPEWLTHENRQLGPEVEFQSSEGFRYAGITEFSIDKLGLAAETVRTSHCAVVVISESTSILSEAGVKLLWRSSFPEKEGIPVTSVDWTSLSHSVCCDLTAIIRVTGLFDDREASVDLIAKRGGTIWDVIFSSLNGRKIIDQNY